MSGPSRCCVPLLKRVSRCPAELTGVNVDTTVETKVNCFPADARLYPRRRQRLVKAVRSEGLTIKLG